MKSTTITRAFLDEVAEALLKHSESHASIEGHTDSIGDADYNLELSFQRADAVKRYLVEEFGISPARLAIIGYGEEKPIVDNDVESMRHQNRRVEVVLFIPASSIPAQMRFPNPTNTPQWHPARCLNRTKRRGRSGR